MKAGARPPHPIRAALIWSLPLGQHCIATPAVYNGLIFVSDCSHKVYCVDAATGKKKWEFDTQSQIHSSANLARIGATDAVLFGAELPVDDEALALGEIMLAGPGGNHLSRPMTRANYRRFHQSGLLDQSAHDRWQAAGATTLRERVAARTQELLTGPPTFTLDETNRRCLRDLVAQAPPGR